jgi:hypothetical protein
MKIIITESQYKNIILNENGLTFYHGGLDPNATISDIDVFKLSSKQQKKGREYAGFYMSPDMDENSFAIQYYSSKPNSGLHKITLPEDSNVYEYSGSIERIQKSELEDLYNNGYDYIAGTNLFGNPEFVLLNKNKATMELVSVNDNNGESKLDYITEMDYRNLDDIIKFGEFSEHFKKEDLKKINKFLLLIRKLGVVNMFQAGDFFLMSIQYFKDFMKMKSYERDFDEDIVFEIEEMLPDIRNIMVGAGMSLVEKNDTEVTPKSVERAIKILVSSIMKYYMTQNLPNVNESYDKAKNFLRDNFGFDFSGRIQQITSTYDVPMEFDDGISPEMIRQFLNYFGPMYLFELDDIKYLYQDRDDFEWFIDEEGYDYVDNEIPEKLGIAEMGFRFSDILDIYFEEEN